ncbi:MAG: hypothetical protein CTY27_07165, partial [Methylotenera sp.]
MESTVMKSTVMQNLKLTALLMFTMPLLLTSNIIFAAQPNDLELLEQVQPPPKVIDGEALEDPALE